MKQMLHEHRRVITSAPAGAVILGLALSAIGDSAARVALVLGAHDGGSGTGGLAVLLMVLALPTVLLVGVSGRLASSLDVRPALLTATVLQIGSAVYLSQVDGWLATLVGAALLQGGYAAASSAWLVSLPRLAPDEFSGAVMSLQQALLGIATPCGAALGGLLFAAGRGAPFVLDAISFAPLLGLCLLIPPRPSGETTTGSNTSVWKTLLPLDGLTALRGQRVLARLIGFVLLFIITIESVNAVEVFLVRDTLGATAAQFGATEAAAGIGVVIGALGSSAVSGTRARIRAVVLLLSAVAAAQLTQGLAPSVGIYLGLAVVVGTLMGAINTILMTLLVTATDLRTRGAVVALVGGAARASSTAALAVGGILGTVATPRLAFVVVGTTGMVIGIAASILVRTAQTGESPELKKRN